MPALLEKVADMDCQKDIIYIATHEDEYKGQEIDMETEIYNCLERANEEYRKVANGTRYTFKKLLRGNLFCVNAKDSTQVSKIFDNINKS